MEKEIKSKYDEISKQSEKIHKLIRQKQYNYLDKLFYEAFTGLPYPLTPTDNK